MVFLITLAGLDDDMCDLFNNLHKDKHPASPYAVGTILSRVSLTRNVRNSARDNALVFLTNVTTFVASNFDISYRLVARILERKAYRYNCQYW